nr:thiamine diphosphokinase [Staphylococcus lutrae]
MSGLPSCLLSHQETAWAGVDRGALILLQNGIVPEFAVGDFDSMTAEEREWMQSKIVVHPVPAEKADTDLALAVHQAVALGYSDIEIYGATGGRLDHFMGAMQLLQHPGFKHHHIKLIDAQNEIMYYPAGQYSIPYCAPYTYISFIPGRDEVVLSLSGFKYNLEAQSLERGRTLTVSNEFAADYGELTIHQGGVYVMRSRDE